MTGLLLHLFFTIILTISLFLLGSLIDKSILELTDVGTEDFFGSGYYLKCMEQKCSDLYDYIQLTQKGEQRTANDDRRYLQYTNEFRQEDTNFCYWYRENGVWYTNQPDTSLGQEFDTQTILMEAKTMGDYLLYDMEKKEFGTDIKGLEDYFFGSAVTSYGEQVYWPLENVVLVIGVDTQLAAMDDLYDANVEYQRLHPWIKVSIAAGLISLMGWIITLVYLTLAAGHREDESSIHLSFIDKIKTELLIAGFILITSELVVTMARVGSRDWDVAGLLVASGTISFIIDVLFLIFYLSMVRRLKAEVVWESSLVCWLAKGMEKTFQERSVTVQILVVFAIHMLLYLLLAIGAFRYDKVFCLILLLLLCAVEAYFLLRKGVGNYKMRQVVEQIAEGNLTAQIESEELHGEERKLAEAINNIGSGLMYAVDASTKNERMKADLITNVSHDIKTPLTSIINYVNLIKRENIDNERVNNYIAILDEKSQRLKQLTEDLVEASKVSSGNIKLDMQKIDIVELVYQTGGEFNEKFENKELTIVTKLPQKEVYIRADGRRLYRVIENLYNNVAKYALEKTRVYVEVQKEDGHVTFSIKNVSERSLALENSQVEDLTERFIRGDSSRTTEGSGLGLSIAKNLTLLMGGKFDITVDGDLFKARIVFPAYEEQEEYPAENETEPEA
jgi:signal transduction histidine kinase